MKLVKVIMLNDQSCSIKMDYESAKAGNGQKC